MASLRAFGPKTTAGRSERNHSPTKYQGIGGHFIVVRVRAHSVAHYCCTHIPLGVGSLRVRWSCGRGHSLLRGQHAGLAAAETSIPIRRSLVCRPKIRSKGQCTQKPTQPHVNKKHSRPRFVMVQLYILRSILLQESIRYFRTGTCLT